MIIILNAKFIPFDEPRKKGASSYSSRSFFATWSWPPACPSRAPISMRLSSLQLPDQSDTQYPDTLSPTWFPNRLSSIRERYVYIRRRERTCTRLTWPLSLPSPSCLLSRSRVSHPLALALFSLTISITRMTEWSESRNPEITFIVITMKHYIYAVGIHGGRRSSVRWGLHSALLTTSYRFCCSSLTPVFV